MSRASTPNSSKHHAGLLITIGVAPIHVKPTGSRRTEDCEKARRITLAVRSRVDSAGAQKVQILCHSHKAGGNRRTRDANKALCAAQSAGEHDDEWTGDGLPL